MVRPPLEIHRPDSSGEGPGLGRGKARIAGGWSASRLGTSDTLEVSLPTRCEREWYGEPDFTCLKTLNFSGSGTRRHIELHQILLYIAAFPIHASRRILLMTSYSLTHLKQLEAESIHVIREVVAEFDNPVMLYSIGKDSSVMVHLALKAFHPAKPPFPLLHVDTTWKFREMIQFREEYAKKELGLDVLTYTNQEGLKHGIHPLDDSDKHTELMKTDALKQALDKYRFNAAFGGARRDEEKSRAKERIFSFRDKNHRWDPKNQRPELWSLYNAKVRPGESIRVFPLSNWTELDVWQYIHLEKIPIVPLYLAAKRPVVQRLDEKGNEVTLLVDDDRMKLEPGEQPEEKMVRFRTLGCYPLSGAVESTATTLPEIIQEMLLCKTSERQGRMIDRDKEASMEKKKKEGYF